MRILTLSFTANLQSGIVKQLSYEYIERRKLLKDMVYWDTLLLTYSESQLPFSKRVPWFFRNLLLRYFYCWYMLIKISSNYDFVMVRYMPFDFWGVFFSKLIKNRISVHHAIEPAELLCIRSGWKGVFSSYIDLYFGKYIVENSVAIMAVTQEIASYQLSRIKKDKPVHILPNGISIEGVDLLDDRSTHVYEGVFLCQEFSAWHGLEKILVDAESCGEEVYPNLIIHLIGELSVAQRNRINSLNNKNIFVIHGPLSQDDYLKIFAKCHFGIASLALELEGLNYGSTLKVREMLAYGLPVYSNHYDSGIYEGFPHYHRTSNVSLSDILNFAKENSKTERMAVFNDSIPYISKYHIMKKASDFICNLQYNNINK